MGILLPSIDTKKTLRPKNRPFVAFRKPSQQDDPKNGSEVEKEQEEEIELDAAMTFSERELLQTIDFEEMSTDEMKPLNGLSKMRLPITEIPLRRFQQSSSSTSICGQPCVLRSDLGPAPFR